MESAVLLSILVRGVEPDFYEKTEEIAKVFDARGFCASQLESVVLFPKCSVIKKSGKLRQYDCWETKPRRAGM